MARAQGGHTPLHFAAGFERVDVTELLLARGAALETRDKARRRSGHTAAVAVATR